MSNHSLNLANRYLLPCSNWELWTNLCRYHHYLADLSSTNTYFNKFIVKWTAFECFILHFTINQGIMSCKHLRLDLLSTSHCILPLFNKYRVIFYLIVIRLLYCNRWMDKIPPYKHLWPANLYLNRITSNLTDSIIDSV